MFLPTISDITVLYHITYYANSLFLSSDMCSLFIEFIAHVCVYSFSLVLIFFVLTDMCGKLNELIVHVFIVLYFVGYISYD